MSHRNAILLLMLTASMWSLGGVLIKLISLPPMTIVGGRSAIACVAMWLTFRRLKFIWTKAQIGAAICLALTVICFVTATKLTTAANAIFLQYTAPIYVAFLSAPLLGEPPHPRDWAALTVILSGMALFFVKDLSLEHIWGNVIALTSSVFFALTAVFLRLQKGQSTVESIFLGLLISACLALPSFFQVPGPIGTKDILLLVVLGVFQLGVPYVFYGIAVRHVTALEATLVPVLEPVLNPIWVLLFVGERPSRFAAAGGAIVIGAVLLHSFAQLRWRQQEV